MQNFSVGRTANARKKYVPTQCLQLIFSEGVGFRCRVVGDMRSSNSWWSWLLSFYTNCPRENMNPYLHPKGKGKIVMSVRIFTNGITATFREKGIQKASQNFTRKSLYWHCTIVLGERHWSVLYSQAFNKIYRRSGWVALGKTPNIRKGQIEFKQNSPNT